MESRKKKKYYLREHSSRLSLFLNWYLQDPGCRSQWDFTPLEVLVLHNLAGPF